MGKVSSKHQKDQQNECCEDDIENENNKSSPKKKSNKFSFLNRKKKKEFGNLFSKKKLEELFETYKNVKEEEDLEEDVIGQNGVAKLLSDIGLGADDVKKKKKSFNSFLIIPTKKTKVLSFVIAWRFGCQEIGYLSKEEFLNGLSKFKIDSVEKFKELVPQLQHDYKENKEQLWKWVFVASQERKVIGKKIKNLSF